MNAIIGLCHFCESHGPRVVFYTYVLKGVTSIPDNNNNQPVTNCPACTSIGNKCFVSRERESIIFCSRQNATSSSIEALFKQACFRSLSCEVSTSKENALIFFSNSTQQEYVLSNTFQLKDTKARGLKRLFSVIVLMRDKMYLLNLTSHFSKEIQAIVLELEGLAESVYCKEQALCSQRALRLRREKMDSDPPRSLIELTGKDNVYAFLHMKFCYMLSSAAKIFKELPLVDDFLPKIFDTSPNANRLNMKIRQLKEFLTESIFFKVLYCTLVGIQVIVRGDSEECAHVTALLESLLPVLSINMECCEYIPPTESRLYYCKTNVAVPQPCSAVCRLDIVDSSQVLHWTGELPEKLPTLMTNILRIMNEQELSDFTIEQQIFALREEWKNHALVLKAVSRCSQAAVSSMKRSLGIKTQDESLVEYWMSSFVN